MKAIVVAFLALAAVASGSILDNQAVYKIMNKADGGVLSMKDSDSTKVYVKMDMDAASQKWRAKKPLLMRSQWELKPTSDESSDLTVDVTSTIVRALPTSGDAKYWHISNYGEGSFEVKSYATDMCLTSQGLNRPVALSPCANSPQQQWKFREL